MRRVILLGLLVFMLAAGRGASAAPAAPADAEKDTDKDILFHWAFGSVRNKAQGPEFEAITGDAVLNSGDQMKFFIEPVSACFVYLLYQSSQGELTILFPYRFKEKAKEAANRKARYIPEGSEWFQLDNHVGKETFHLLASATRLKNLETMVNQYESADKTRRPDFATQIVTEIGTLRRRHSKLKSAAERPISIIGGLRGTQQAGPPSATDLAAHGVEISADNFYSRTFTIDHR